MMTQKHYAWKVKVVGSSIKQKFFAAYTSLKDLSVDRDMRPRVHRDLEELEVGKATQSEVLNKAKSMTPPGYELWTISVTTAWSGLSSPLWLGHRWLDEFASFGEVFSK